LRGSGEVNVGTLPYSAANKKYNIVNGGWKAFFVNSDSENCPISNCQLYEQNCETSLPSKFGISIERNANQAQQTFDIYATQGVILGYDLNICVRCQNKH
jgi:hypothetical protein